MAQSEELSAASEEANTNVEKISEMAKINETLGERLNICSKDINDLSEKSITLESNLGKTAQLAGKIETFISYKIDQEKFKTIVTNAIEAHKNWVNTIDQMVNNMNVLPLQIDGKKCGFGHFYNSINIDNPKIKAIWESIDKDHLDLHIEGHKVIESIKNSDKNEVLKHQNNIHTLSKSVIKKLGEVVSFI